MEALYTPAMLYVLLYLLTGVFAGLAAGLLGVGGGIVNVPALTWCFGAQGIPADPAFHLALGTSLATIVFTGGSAAWAHYRQGNVDFFFGLKIAFCGVFGSVCGSYLASRLTAVSLKPAFGVLLVATAVNLFFDRQTKHAGAERRSWTVAAVTGVLAGIAAGFFGVGGGVVAIPLMLWLGRFEPKRAVATSTVMIIVMGLCGSLTYVTTGRAVTRDIPWAFGYVHVLALIFIAASSIVTARLGAALAARIDARGLKRLFALMLLAVGVKFISSLW